MSEKRFTFEYDDGQWGVPLFYDDGKKLCFDDVVDLLNEQQATIEQLQKSKDVKEFSALFNQSIALKREIKDLKEENEQLKNKLNKGL